MNSEFSASQVWLTGLRDLIKNGECVSPRGMKTWELPQKTFVIDTRLPVVTIKERSLNYRFMAAEAYWILSGDDRVETIAPYNSKISQFSDNGKTFFGAYGPKISKQFPYVIQKLSEDRDSRQAGLTIWRECPPTTKDVPCTVAIFFAIRNGKVNCHVFMRSSDIWLGLPYDVFNFSMLTHKVCSYLNARARGAAVHESLLGSPTELVTPGRLYLTAASSHLYDRDVEVARGCLSATRAMFDEPFTNENMYNSSLDQVEQTMLAIRDGGRANRWWEA